MADYQNQEMQPEMQTPEMAKKQPKADAQYNPIQMANPNNLPPEALYREVVHSEMGRFKKWEDWRRPLESIWAEIYRLYVTAGSGSHLPTRAHVTLPIVFQIIEAALPKLVTIVFGQPEWFSAVSRSTKNPVKNEELLAHTELLQYQLEKASFFSKFVEFAKQLFMYGTSYFFVYQKVQREWVYERTPKRGPLSFLGLLSKENNLEWEKKLVYKVVERRPEIDVLPIEDVYPDPDARTEQDSEGIYVTSSISKKELKEMSTGKFPVYGNWEEVERNLAAENKYERQQFKVDKRSIRGTGQKTTENSGDMVELITFWGKYDLDGDGIREEVQMVYANRQCLIKAIRNPFEHQKRPIIRGVLFSVPLEWFGMGLVEPVIGLIHELITIRNQNIDMNNLIINRMWKVSSIADVDLDTLVSSPNGIILTGDMEGVQPIPQDPIPVSPLQMSELIQADIENATAPKSIQGAPTSGALGRTARGAQLIISQALEKFGMGAKLIEEIVIKRVLVLFKKLNEQYLDSDEILNHFYGDVIRGRLTPEQMRADLDFKLLGISDTVTSEATINQLIAFYNIAANNPNVNLSRVLQEIWSKMKLGIPANEVVQDNPAPLQSQVAQIPGAALGQGGPGGPSAAVNQAAAAQVQQNGSGAPAAQ